jgi:hypothetical protein
MLNYTCLPVLGRLLFCLIGLPIPAILLGQCTIPTWTYTIDGNVSDIIQRTARHANGDLYIAGTTSSFISGQDILIARLVNDTTLVWAKAIHLSGVDGGETLDLHVGASGHVYITCAMDAGLEQDAGLLKLDEHGNVQWARRVLPMAGLAHGRAVMELPDGGVLMAGSTNSIGAGNVDAFMARFTSSGALVWLNSYGGSGQDHITDMHRLADDTYIVNSQTSSFNSSTRKGYTARIASNGAVLSARQYGGAVYDDLVLSCRNQDGTFLRIGFTDSSGPGQRDVLAILTDSIGNTIWSRAYGTPGGNEWGLNAVQRPGGGWFVTAMNTSDRQLYLLHLRSDGSLERTFKMLDLYVHNTSSWMDAIQASNDGHFLVTASMGNSMNRIALVKLDACGENFCDMMEVNWASTTFTIPEQPISFPVTATSTNVQMITPVVTNITSSMVAASSVISCIGSGIISQDVPSTAIHIRPNPVRAGTEFWIDFQNEDRTSPIDLVVLDVTGRLVSQHRLPDPHGPIEAPAVPGLYSIQIYRDGRMIALAKAIIQ